MAEGRLEAERRQASLDHGDRLDAREDGPVILPGAPEGVVVERRQDEAAR